MSFDYLATRNSIKAMMEKSLTALSTGLQDTVSEVQYGDPERTGVQINRPDNIFLQIQDITENQNSLGSGAHRQTDFTVVLWGVTQVGVGSYDISATSETEMLRLAQNITDLIRTKPSLSITGLWQRQITVKYDEPSNDTSTYNRCSRIDIQCSKLILP